LFLVSVGARGRAWGPFCVVQMNVRGNGFRITDRDEAIVRFVGLQVGVEARQIAGWQAMDKAHVFRRCRRLVELGLLRQERVVHGRPGLYLATKAGLDFAELELPAARVSLWSYAHALELVWLWIDLEREFGPDRVLTERQIRSLEFRDAWAAEHSNRRHRPRYALSGSGGPKSLHFPDLVVDGGAPEGGALFVELELTVKGSERRREIVRSYVRSAQAERVRYYAAGDALAAMGRTLAHERADFVELREWWPTASAAQHVR
jgi:hypothetical protein